MKKAIELFKSKDAPVYRSAHSFVLSPVDLEHPVGVSQTVPDQAYSIKDLVSKYVRGMMPPIGAGHMDYGDADADFDDVDMEKIRGMDLHERAELVRETLESGRDARTRIEEGRKQPKAAEKKAREAGAESRSDDPKVEDERSERRPATKARRYDERRSQPERSEDDD